MALIETAVEKAKGIISLEPTPIPKSIEVRMKRGRDAMREGAPKRNECLAFARGRQYKWVDAQNVLKEQNTAASPIGDRGKPRHRVRQTRNFIFDIVENEVATSVQKVPGYDIAPSSAEPKRESAAGTARKVAFYGYDKWDLRHVTERVVRYAIVADEGFAWPFFDNTVGPYHLDAEGNLVGEGELRIRTFGPNEVFWEPGLPFDESRWHGIEQARDIADTMELEGYLGGKLTADAQKAETEKDSPQDKLVLVTDYLERPSPKNPSGRWITMANHRVIVAERPYPCIDPKGAAVDEPVLHKLTYSMDPETDRDSGLVRHLIDAQRTVNYCNNKITEWAALALNPQIIIQNGQLKQKLTDEPGAVYNAVGTGEMQWRPTPNTPGELFKQKEEAISDMGRIAAQNDIPNQVESGRGIAALIEKDNSRRANFLENLAQFHSRLMRHCLYLVQRHYTEPRTLKVRGERGIWPLKNFLGAELLGEVDVRVSAGSLESLTREAVEGKIMAFAERGWISPHAAMAAINSGTAENLVDSYERDVARANLIIQKILEGPEVLFASPERRPFFGEDPGFNEETQLPNEHVPGWMPRPFDSVPVQKDVFADWMKGTEYDDLSPPQQEAANTYYDALLQLEAKQQAQAAEAQAQTAESLGMSNAAKPQGPPPLPDQAPLNKE